MSNVHFIYVTFFFALFVLLPEKSFVTRSNEYMSHYAAAINVQSTHDRNNINAFTSQQRRKWTLLTALLRLPNMLLAILIKSISRLILKLRPRWPSELHFSAPPSHLIPLGSKELVCSSTVMVRCGPWKLNSPTIPLTVAAVVTRYFRFSSDALYRIVCFRFICVRSSVGWCDR